MDDVERVARAIWAKRPDCAGKPWPIETALQRRAYPHNPIAACDLCFEYARAAIKALAAQAMSEVPLSDQQLARIAALRLEKDAAGLTENGNAL